MIVTKYNMCLSMFKSYDLSNLEENPIREACHVKKWWGGLLYKMTGLGHSCPNFNGDSVEPLYAKFFIENIQMYL